MDRIILQDTPLPDLKLIKRNPISDQRGFLQRMYCHDFLSQAGLSASLVQINMTLTRATGAIRGMHFQRHPHAETKIVTCLRGRVFDVAVDLRKDSPTFLQWHAEILSPDLCNSFLIPEGFAHGFQTLSDDCELLYFHTASYHQPSEGGLSPTDPLLNITWPLAITEISDRDSKHPFLTAEFKGLSNEM